MSNPFSGGGLIRTTKIALWMVHRAVWVERLIALIAASCARSVVWQLSRLTIRFREQYYRRFKRTQSGEVGPMRYRRTGKWTVVNPEFGLFFQAQSVFAG